MGASAVGVVTVSAGFIGFGKVAIGIRQFGYLVGLDSITKIVSGAAFIIGMPPFFFQLFHILGVGTISLILAEAQNTVETRVAKKIKRQIRKSERIQRRLHKVGYESRKCLEKASFELKKTISNIVEVQEVQCKNQQQIKIVSGKATKYFGNIKNKSRGLLELLEKMNVDALAQ